MNENQSLSFCERRHYSDFDQVVSLNWSHPDLRLCLFSANDSLSTACILEALCTKLNFVGTPNSLEEHKLSGAGEQECFLGDPCLHQSFIKSEGVL